MKIGLVALMLVLGGCGSSGNANNAGSECMLEDSHNACLRCWAQKCPSQLDYCYGAGFHSGELVSGNTTSSAAPCASYATAVQICGCFGPCFDRFSDQIGPQCADCQTKYFSACREQNCSQECSSGDGGS
jgi:hypothetical protein